MDEDHSDRTLAIVAVVGVLALFGFLGFLMLRQDRGGVLSVVPNTSGVGGFTIIDRAN